MAAVMRNRIAIIPISSHIRTRLRRCPPWLALATLTVPPTRHFSSSRNDPTIEPSTLSSSLPTSSPSHPSMSLMDPLASRYLSRHGIAPTLHEDMARALIPVYGKPLTVKHLKQFGKEGLIGLAQSIERTMPDRNSTVTRSVHIAIPHHKTEFQLTWYHGQSLLELAQQNADLLGEYMEGSCGGTMSCCTCHVYVGDRMVQALPPPSEAELDMLDLAYQPCDESRLGCQVRLCDELLALEQEDLKIAIPADVNDVWK